MQRVILTLILVMGISMKISIIMVTYNSDKTLEQALQSVVNQEYLEKELIIIDGKSTDLTVPIIKNYESYVTYWNSEPDGGVYDAMNKGLQKATGDIIAFLNSDDWYENGALERVNMYFQSDEIDILAGKANCVLNNRIYQDRQTWPKSEEIHIQMIYYHQGMFVRKEIFEQIGNFNLNYKITADYDWTLRAFQAGCNIKMVEDVFVNYRCDGLSAVQRYKGLKEQREIACLHAGDSEEIIKQINLFYNGIGDTLDLTLYNLVWKYSGEFVRGLCREDVKYYIWGAGIFGRTCCKLFWAVGLEIAGFIDNDSNIDTCMGYPVMSPEQLNGDEWICISSEKYEDEIHSQILAMGYSKQKILRFSEIRNLMVKYGRDHYIDMVLK